MKNLKFFLPLAAVGLLASCSNDNVEAPQEPEQEFKVGETTYMNLSISMASRGTRADGLQDFDGAYAGEQDLDDGWVFLFNDNGGQPNACVAKGYIDAKALNSNVNADIQGTINFYGIPVDNSFSDKTSTANPSPNGTWHPDNDAAYHALIILNAGSNNEGITLPQVSTTTNTYTFAQWSAEMTKTNVTNKMRYQNADQSKTYYTMTNALGWPNVSTTDPDYYKTVPNVLVKITSDNLYQGTNHQESKVVNFYVQRVLSKITLGETSAYRVGTAKDVSGTFDEGATKPKVKLTAWELNVTNTKTYPVQKIDGAFSALSTYISDWSTLTGQRARFVGANSDGFKRVYWAIDPNYSAADPEEISYANDFEILTTADQIADDQHNSVKFCFENTFDIANMNKDQSTAIVFKAVYYWDGTEKDVADSFVSFGPYCYKVTDTELKVTASGSYTLSELFTDPTSDNAKAVLSNLHASAEDKLNYYRQGVCFYNVILRHFANDELDLGEDQGFYDNWNFRGKYLAGSTPDENEMHHYLGRYGLVRNNWYIININSISGPGETNVPTPTPTPDDNPNPYKIDMTINVLNWAKREHGYDI